MPPSLTPSIITAWLACPHSLTLHRLEHEGEIEKADEPRSAFSRLVQNKGEHHERECLEALRARFGNSAIFEPPLLNKSAESFEAYLGRVTLPDLQAFKGLYQIPLAHDGMRGIADFLITVDDAGQPLETFMPIDAKLARKEAKPGHVLQLCFYADAVEAITGKRPEGVRIWLGKGGADAMEEIRLDEIAGYWRHVRADLASLLEATAPEETRPEPCDHCAFCKFQDRCEGEWREADSLHYVASLTRRDREKLSAAGIASRGALASSTGEVKRFDAARLARLRLQARLQVEARPDSCVEVAVSTDTPVHVLPATEGEGALRGFPQLPPEDAGDVYVDYEGHPFFTVQEGLIFLIGLLYRNDAGDWVYEPRWAHSKADEAEQMRRLAVWFEHRRAQHPDMHVYHYNHTERSTITTILDASDAPDAVVETLKTLLSEGIFVDLYTVVRQSLVVGVESYGLKTIERVAGYDRAGALQFAVLPLPQGDEADEALARGSDVVLKYEDYAHGTHLTEAQRDALLASIAHYNLRDLEALVVVVGWLRALCPEEVQWVRPTPPEESENVPLEVVARLQETDGTQGEHLMAEVLSYYKREKSAHDMQIRVTLDGHEDDLRDDEEALVGLQWVEGSKKWRKYREIEVHIGAQVAHTDFFAEKETLRYWGEQAYPSSFELSNGDAAKRIVRAKWEIGRSVSAAPSCVVLDGYVHPGKKPESLREQAQKRLDTGSFSTLAGNLLLRTAAPAPSGGYAAQPDAIASHILQLDEGAIVPIQGPPGTGKTWMGAELALRLINAGKTIGIVAMSHAAATHLLSELCHKAEYTSLRIAHKTSQETVEGVTPLDKEPSPDEMKSYNVFVGTPWFFAGKVFPQHPVDFLFVDEAGQFALADALAVSRGARSMVLLGDPLQLPQVMQAVHPEGVGVSVLEHMLAGEPLVTPDRGLLLETTYRMHPDVCAFISRYIYQGRLQSDARCAEQTIHRFGTGLRHRLMNHEGCSERSDDEVAEVVAMARQLLGTTWTHTQAEGPKPMTAADVLVVAPYNAQRRAIRAALDSDPRTAGVRVGTVDKFQGQEAPAVIFSMTASSAADIPRGADFLFDRNRLNVAISRARCLAVIVVNKALLNSRPRDIEQMRLISTLCSAVHAGTPFPVDPFM